MAIDYALQLPCEVRKTIPEARLFALVKQWAIAEFAISRFQAAYPQADRETLLTQCTVEISVTGPDGTEKQTPVTLAQLLALVAPLQSVRSHCQACRANVADRDFGCIGKVNYPITRDVEEWLLARLPADAKDANLRMLLRFLSEMGIDGAALDGIRARAKIFESASPVARGWGMWPARKKISSSQILQLLAFGGTVDPDLARLTTRLLGLTTILSEPHPPTALVEQFKTLACAIVMAGRLDAPLYIEA